MPELGRNPTKPKSLLQRSWLHRWLQQQVRHFFEIGKIQSDDTFRLEALGRLRVQEIMKVAPANLLAGSSQLRRFQGLRAGQIPEFQAGKQSLRLARGIVR